MESRTPWHIFVKYFQNKAESEDISALNDWLEEDAENIETLNEVYNIYAVSSGLPPVLNPNVKEAWDKINRKTTVRKSFVSTIHGSIKYVAAVAVLVVAFLGVQKFLGTSAEKMAEQYSEVTTRSGEKTSVKLPDGTTVWLNASSSVQYSSMFNQKEREITLTGEAYFKVAKDKTKRFRVKSGALYIDVYGTSFDVKNYPDNSLFEVTVAEGIVGIADHHQEMRKLTRGEKAVFDKKTGKIVFTNDDPELVSAWKNDELIFKDTPIEDVVRSLESWYGVTIQLDERMLGSHSYSFRIKTESFREVMDMMKLMTPFDYKINGKDVKLKYNQ